MATNQSLMLLLELARDGTLLEKLEEQFRELNLEVIKQGRAGELVLKIKAVPDDGNVVDYQIEPLLKLPKRKPIRATMFINRKSGAAQESNSEGKQGELEIETQSQSKPALRAIEK